MPASPMPPATPDPEAPRPIATARAPAGPGLAGARAQMPAMYEDARKASAQLGALLNSVCDIIGADETELVLGFKFPLHAERVSARTNLTILSEIASRLLGRTVSVRCVQDDSVESWRQRETASRPTLRSW